MLEITSNDVAALSDGDLRDLVGLLCESELRSHGLSTSAVTWGGDQNASDGGIDVRVRIEDGAPPGGFVPKTSVGFQVKKTDFTPGLIGPEMRPEGELRESIRDLIDESGAYIIASSASNTSKTALTNRLKAMQSAVADYPRHANLHLDFYDRNRLATWIRNHPGLVIWVRKRIGRGLAGWQPYSSWATSPDGEIDEYLLDDKASLHAGIADEKGTSVAQGIDRIRDILREVRGIVRLAGLSGVGKTRLVQALFDSRVGRNPIDPALVIYTDMNDNPSPQPTGMISDLVASRARAIVVVDNCAPDLHRRITEVCQASDSLISAITVEYDVQEDEPEGTEVFRLEPSSVQLVAKLIARRYPVISDLDVDRISKFSGGNARVALVLAKASAHHGSVAGLQDEELFKRLFYQRQERDDSLLKAAQACALLYSFQGEALNGDDAELPKIAALVGTSPQQLFAKVSQLKQRDLVQRRSVWRAILPHAIANRLAQMALREIPFELIEAQFDSERLLKSFSRRLGYLHESDEAKRIVERWLSKDGRLADVGNLTHLGLTVFDNIAPVAPEATLASIEVALSGPNASKLINDESRRNRIGTLLYSIAYDASLFNRCVAGMIRLALAESSDGPNHVRRALDGLFHILLSGTHASVSQRVRIADDLLSSGDPAERLLGIHLLEALLKSHAFSATHSFEFGARVRDYGYWPKSREENSHWFAATLQLARQVTVKNDENALTIRSTVAQSIRGLWFLGREVQDQFEAIAAEIATSDYWQAGWIAVRFLLSHLSDTNKEDSTALERLRDFETRLRPKNVIEQVRTVVLSDNRGPFDYADLGEAGALEKPVTAREKAYVAAEELGKMVCGDETAIAVLLPDLVMGKPARLYPFGRGLALACADHRILWDQLVHAISNTAEDKRNIDGLRGFLNGLSTVDSQLCEALLDEALTHHTLGAWFPGLQSALAITNAGTDRLKRAVVLGRAQPWAFQFLGWERTDDAVSARDLQALVTSLAKCEHGHEAAIDILAARLYSNEETTREYPSELIDTGRELLATADFSIRSNTYDYHLRTIAKVCIRDVEGAASAVALCDRIKLGLSDRTFDAFHFEELLKSVFELQPRIALNMFFRSEPQNESSDFAEADFNPTIARERKPLDLVPIEVMCQWCDESAAARYPILSRFGSFDTVSQEGAKWSPFAIEMLKRAPDPQAILKIFVKRFHPTSWSGSLSAIIESRLGLLDQIRELNNPCLDEYATEIKSQLINEIATRRKFEDERDKELDERFE